MKINLKTVICCLSLILTTVGLSYGQNCQSGTGVVTMTANSGSCLATTPAQSNGPVNFEVAQGGSYNMTISGVTECAGEYITVFVQNSGSQNFCFNAWNGGSGNNYTGTFTVPNNSCSTSPVSYKCGMDQACNNLNTFDARGSSSNCVNAVHLRTNSWGASCSGRTVIACSNCIPVSIFSCTGGGDYGCNPATIPVEPPAISGTNASSSFTDDTTQSGCAYTITRTWVVTGDCGGTLGCIQVYTYTQANDLTFDGLPTGSDLGCNPATLPGCDEAVTASNECGPATVVCTPGEISSIGCGFSQTFNYHASTTCGGDADENVTYTWTVVTAPVLANLPAGGALECNPAAPACDEGVTASNECGSVPVICTPGAVIPDGCNRSQTFTYSATDACSDMSSSEEVLYTWFVSSELVITPSGSTNICSGSCVQLNATEGFTGYQWHLNGVAIDGETESSIEACDQGDYSVTASNNCSCTSSSEPVPVSVFETPTCNIDPIDESDLPAANSDNNQLCAETSDGVSLTYSWTLVSSNNSWSITGPSDGQCVTYHAGTFGSTGTFTFTVTVDYGDGITCTSEACTITLTTQSNEQCSYTQGFYGQSTGKTSCTQLTAPTVIAQALSSGNIVLGNPAGTRRLTLTAADVSCIVSRMPGNSTADTLDVKNPSGWTCANFLPLQGTKFKNVLVGQTLALAINARLYPSILNYHLTSTSFTTYTSADCNPATDIIVPNSGQTFTIPAAVINCLGPNPANNTVAKLLDLANRSLGGLPLGCVSGAATQSQITEALDAVNKGFDKCRIISGNNIRLASQTVSGIGGFSFNYQPNPTNGITRATFVAPSNGNATIEVYNLTGELVKTVYSENVSEGNSYTAEFDAALFSDGVYFIQATVGSNTAHGKLVIVK